MTLIQIEKRVKALERTVQVLARSKHTSTRKWYRSDAGRFADDAVFDEIVRLGRSYRRAQQPRRGSKR